MRTFRLILMCVCLVAAMAGCSDEEITVGKPVDPSLLTGQEVRFKIELSGAKNNVKLQQLPDGSVAYIVKRAGAGTDLLLTPDEFAKLYYEQQTKNRGWLMNGIFFIFNTTSLIGIAWVALGLGGQLVFGGRMLVQWLESEKHGRSMIPLSFWWMSVVGSTMLILYFIWRRDIVGIIGQSTGWPIYIRNLVLIYKARRLEATAAK